MQIDHGLSSILKLCRCKRPFDMVSGQPLRMNPNDWIPGSWVASSQPCKLCEPSFYRNRAIEHLDDTVRIGEKEEEK